MIVALVGVVVGPDQQETTGRHDEPFRRLPGTGIGQVVGHEESTEINVLVAGVEDLQPIVVFTRLIGDRRLVVGHELVDVQLRDLRRICDVRGFGGRRGEVLPVLAAIRDTPHRHIGSLITKHDRIDKRRTIGRVETDLLAARAKFKVGMQRTVGCVGVGPDEQVAAGRNDGAVGNHPHRRNKQVIGHVQTAQVEFVFTAVVELDPILERAGFVGDDRLVVGHELIDEEHTF